MASEQEIFKYMNVKNSLRNMSNEEFESFLDSFSEKLFNYGFENLLTKYNNSLKLDWDKLVTKNIEKDCINSTSVVGMNIIKKNMPHIYEVCNYKGKSIKNTWNKKQIKKTLITNRKSHSTPYISEIIRQLGFTSGTSKITIYRPLLTKRIIETFNATNVLDVCIGWGGRMLGTLCVPNTHYTGIEPFSKTYEGLLRIKEQLKLDNAVIYNDTAENILPKLEKKYDLALTSPPYYNLEIYSQESTQSHNYGTYEEWITHFLKPVVYGVLDKLVDNGKSCWSVKNFKSDKTYNLYDDIVRLHQEKGWVKLEREFYVGNCIRPGFDKKGKEITYVFVNNT